MLRAFISSLARTHIPFARSTLITTRRMTTNTLVVLDDADLKDGQMKEVEFGDGKVLLSRLGDKVHATSAFCTHYGAPLAKGVLAADGRVVCPWHGACFNVSTGDIEDAPALDAIHSFKTHVADGKIYVTADPTRTLKENKSRAPTLQVEGAETFGKGVVIVGGGSGAINAVESLRENGYKAPITILTLEHYPPIDRTKLSKALITESSKAIWRSASDLKIKYGTNVRTGVTVTSIDTKAKKVTLDSKEQIGYEQVILATGGSPRRLPVEGANLGKIFTLRHVENVKDIVEAAQEGKRMVVIGSSFITMELVQSLANNKLASVDVIGLEEFPFEAALGKEVGKGFKQYHESKGVKFHMQSKVEKILPSSSDSSVAGAVVLGDGGPTLDADFVVMGVGVSPATGFLKDSGIPLERDGGVKVDEFLRVPGHQDVYAIGDIAHYPQVQTKEHRRIEHWNVAGNHGRAVGRAIAGRPLPFEKVPIFWSTQGLRYAGLGVGFEEVHIVGNPAELKFVAYYIKGDSVVAVASMQADPVVIKVSELLRLGLMPSASDIKNGTDPLSIDISSTQSKAKFNKVK